MARTRPLCREKVLRYFPAVDTVCVGESDRTFLEIADRVARGESRPRRRRNLHRDGSRVVEGPKRDSIADLDDLASVQAYFDTHILMTPRGCPWNCTFCGAETSWGRGFRANSVDYVVEAVERVLARLPVKMIQIKDDTFTTHKPRVLELCRRIRERKLDFFWSCDTRVDLLTDELLREMRLAGCQRLSLGVESGSQKILDLIDKKITTDEILASTALAKKYGIKVRYYMMLGNRGETRETFEETLAFLERARPHEYVFSCLSIYPGTRDFEDAEARREGGKNGGWLDRNVYFTETFQELKTPFDASDADTALMNAWFREHNGLRTMAKETAGRLRADPRAARRLPRRAHGPRRGVLSRGSAGPGRQARASGARARISAAGPRVQPPRVHCVCTRRRRRDDGSLHDRVEGGPSALRADPERQPGASVVQGGWAGKKLPLSLDARHDFQLLERTVQPTLPGPLPDAFEQWTTVPLALAAEAYAKTPDVEGSKKELGDRRRLKLV